MTRKSLAARKAASAARSKADEGHGVLFHAIVAAIKRASKTGRVPEYTPDTLKQWAMRQKTRHSFWSKK